jgi:histidyl-tRNA synthetase
LVELYPDSAKMAKQFQHADRRNIPFAVIAGEGKRNGNNYALKENLSTYW